MLRRSLALTLLLVGSAAWAQSPASKAEDSVRRLGSGRYQDRERAYRELEAIGDDALESLKKAVQSNEPEVRKRAEDLLLKIEERQTQTKLLAPKMVRLNVTDMPVLDAVAELTKVSTYPIQFQGDRTALANRKMTLDTGETTFWKAFDALCAKGNLVETNVAQPPQGRVGRGYIGGIRQPMQQGPILVANGDPTAQRFVYLGAVRIRLTNVAPAKSDRPVFSVEATAEPRLQSFQIMHDPVIDRAIDDLGQALIPVTNPTDRNVVADDIGFIMPNGMVPVQGRQNQIRFEATPKAGTKVSLMKGTMNASMQVPDKDLVVVKDVMKNVGTPVKGKDGSGMTIVAFDKVGSDYRARIRMEGNQNMGNNGVIFGGAGQVIIQGNVVINNGGFGGGGQRSSMPTLTDEKGQPFVTGPVTQNGVTINNGNISTEMTVTFRGANLGTPTTMTLSGTRQVALPLPFEYRDLPMR